MSADTIIGVVGAAVGVAGFAFGWVQRNDAKRLRDRTQAEQISGWAERRVGDEREVVVHNPTTQAIRHVSIWLARDGDGDRAPDRTAAAHTDLLRPGDPLKRTLTGLAGTAPRDRPDVILAFTDAEGRGWLRTADGRLIRTKA